MPRRGTAIDDRLNQTRRLVRNVDLLIAALAMTTVFCAVGLLAVLADHWLFKGGLPVSLRLGIGLVCFLGGGWYVFRRILPLFLLPINPVYAAKVLEQDTPTLKNTLVNWILLRRERIERGAESQNPLADRMFDGVTQTAVSSLARISSDRGVEWRIVQYWSFALLILLGTLFVYGLFSPKSLGTSLARLLLPFNGIAAPQTVRFVNVRPENITVQQGERLNISAEVVGPSRKPVYLVFSTDDGRFLRERIPMTQPEGAVRFEVPFPPGKQGIVCGSDYWIQCGDSRSQTYRIDVRPVAILEVESLTYRYPAYTGLADETIEHGGDIKAVDGTEVRLVAKSTVPLDRASIVFDNDPKQVLPLSISGEDFRQAAVLWKLESDLKSTQPVTVHSYTFRATDKEGCESRRSGIYRIEILPDKPPVVQWSDLRLQEGNDVIELPLNGTLDMPFTAEDPDFGLRFLRFHVESGNNRILPVDLLESPPMGPTKHTGVLRMKHVFSPVKSRLSVGDAAELWIEAVDTRFPNPNSATTRRIAVKIIDPQEQQERREEQQPPKPEDEPKEANQPKDGENQNEENANQEEQQPRSGNEEKDGNSNDENDKQEEPENGGEGEDKKPVDPETNSGDAMQKIADQMEKDNKENAADQQEQKPGEQPQPKEEKDNKPCPDCGKEDCQGECQGGESGTNAQDGKEDGDQGNKPGQGSNSSTSNGNDDLAGTPTSEGSGEQKTDKEGGRDGSAENAAEDDGKGSDDGRRDEGQGARKEEGDRERGPKGEEDEVGKRGEKREVPVDPDKKGPRERSDLLDEKSNQRSDEGGDASNPKKSDNDLAGTPAKDDKQPGAEEKLQPGDKQGEKQADKPGNVDNQEGEPTNDKGEPTGTGKAKDGQQSEQSGGGEKPDDNLAGTPAKDATPPPDGPKDAQGKGLTGGNQAPPSVETDVEEANLKYAEKVTNLVLEYLEDQMDEPNPELLKELGWTKDQLRQFAEKWKKMAEQGQKAVPGSPDAEAWKEALKSLGLKPDRDRTGVRRGRRDFKDKDNVMETQRYVPPPSLRQRLKDYTERIGKE